MRNIASLALPLLALLLAAPAGAQDKPPADGPSPEAATGETGRGLTIQETVLEIDLENLEEAIVTLEPLRDDPEAQPQQLSLLGVLYLEAGRAEEALAVLAPLAEPEAADPAVLYNAGRAALTLGRTEPAIRYFERSIERAPGSPAMRELGLLRATLGRPLMGYRLLKPWATAHPDDVEARLAAAVLAIELGRPAEAEQFLGDLPQSEPRVRLLWGRLLLAQNEPHGALATLKPLLEGHPPELADELARALAEGYLATDQPAEAVAILERRGSADAPSILLLARAHHAAGDAEAALATVTPLAALALEAPAGRPDAVPLGAAPIREQGRFLVALGRAAEAVTALERASELDPDDAESWRLLGEARAAAGDAAGAEEARARVAELGASDLAPEELQARRAAELADPVLRSLRLAAEALARDQPEEALRIARREIAVSPDDLRPRSMEVRALLALQRGDDALAAARRALVVAPTSPDAHYQLGVARLVTGDAAGAEEDLRRALELAPGHLAAKNDLAVLLIGKGERDEARELLEQVVAANPDDARARENLESLGGGGDTGR